VTTVANRPYDWLKIVEPELVPSGASSSFSGPEAFSWDKLGQLLAKHFEIPDLHLSLSRAEWLPQDRHLEGIGSPTTTLQFAISNLPGSAHWTISTSDGDALMVTLLTKQPSSLEIIDEAFREGFLHYIGAETLVLLSQLGFTDTLALRLLGQQPLPTQGQALCLDLLLTALGRTYTSRVVITQELANSWKEFFIRSSRRREIPLSLAQKIEIVIHLEAGRVTLPLHQWKSLSPGDFITLDHCSVIPGMEKGRVTLTAGGIPLFRGMLKKEQIKILEYPLYHEVETPMNHDESEENHEEEDFTETDEDGEEETEFETEYDHDEKNEQDGDEDNEEVTEIEEEEEAEATPTEPSSLNSLDSIPLNIVVEIGRLNMTLAKLKELQPGHLLELDIKPEQGVDLTINGRCVGRGELLRVGESLGVRVLELG
jgi:flagellar motor switch protein FliN